jgi:hypothetical protein
LSIMRVWRISPTCANAWCSYVAHLTKAKSRVLQLSEARIRSLWSDGAALMSSVKTVFTVASRLNGLSVAADAMLAFRRER